MSRYILTIPPEGPLQFIQTEDERPTLERLQRLVGGYIEPVKMHGRIAAALPKLTMLVNEEGMIRHLAPNWSATLFAGSKRPLYGTAVVVASKDDDYCTLTEDDVDIILDQRTGVFAVEFVKEDDRNE